MSKNDKKIRIFSALEVANICGVVNQTAINWIKNSHLKAFTTPGGQYRIYAEDLHNFLNGRGMRIPEELQYLNSEDSSFKILIIDDEEELNDMLKSYLARKFPAAEISQAFDGFEAGKLLTENKPSVIILDIGLPGVDGFKLCRKIKSDPIFDKSFIVSISGLNSDKDREQILKEGANEFMAKPLDFTLLTEILENQSQKN
ncbi:MAG: response regulator [Spirochaetales bacterium]|nr:response regulator [Spirochaetales bacterium]